MLMRKFSVPDYIILKQDASAKNCQHVAIYYAVEVDRPMTKKTLNTYRYMTKFALQVHRQCLVCWLKDV